MRWNIMPDYRKYLLENGTGVDLHGKNETKAAQRAVKDAISHSSMIGLGALFKIGSFAELEDALIVDVTIGTPNPDSERDFRTQSRSGGGGGEGRSGAAGGARASTERRSSDSRK